MHSKALLDRANNILDDMDAADVPSDRDVQLQIINELKFICSRVGRACELLERVIAACEASGPPLPAGHTAFNASALRKRARPRLRRRGRR